LHYGISNTFRQDKNADEKQKNRLRRKPDLPGDAAQPMMIGSPMGGTKR
jgi:hypothetical protein